MNNYPEASKLLQILIKHDPHNNILKSQYNLMQEKDSSSGDTIKQGSGRLGKQI